MGNSLYDYCMDRNNAALLDQWVEDKNGELTTHTVSYGSHKKVWWRCEADHQWEAPVYARTVDGSGCPYCAGKKMLPTSKNLLSEYPQLLKEWHPQLNEGIFPEKLAPCSHRRVWWKCSKGHEWHAQVSSRVRGAGCPFCKN